MISRRKKRILDPSDSFRFFGFSWIFLDSRISKNPLFPPRNFITQVTLSTGQKSYPSAVIAADMNKDGYLDIVIGKRSSIDILLGDSKGNFGMIINTFIGFNSFPSVVVADDINNDNKLDVVIADRRRDNVVIFLGFGNGSLLLTTTYSTGSGSSPNSVALGDLNNDTYLDIVVAHTGLDRVGVLLGYGNGSFATQATYQLEQFSYPFSLALGDLNNDNRLDIVVTIIAYSHIQIFLGFGNGTFAVPARYYFDTTCHPFHIILDNFNHDDQLDIAVLCDGNNSFMVLFGRKDGYFLQGRKHPIVNGSPFNTMVSGDFNDDSQIDLIVVSPADGTITIFIGDGNEIFGTPSMINTGSKSKPHSVAMADFDGDNESDIAVANYGTNSIGIMLSNKWSSNENFTTYSTGPGSHPHALVLFDFNNDKQLDIAVTIFGTNDVTIFRGYGDGSFINVGSYSTGVDSIPRSIAVADFDNDQKLDLVIANTGANNVLLLFGFGNGTFGNNTFYSMGYNSRPYSVAVGDFDRDGWMDIAVANFGADYVEILLQPCKRL